MTDRAEWYRLRCLELRRADAEAHGIDPALAIAEEKAFHERQFGLADLSEFVRMVVDDQHKRSEEILRSLEDLKGRILALEASK